MASDYDDPDGVLIEQIQTRNARIEKLEAELREAERLIDVWVGDLEAISDDPLPGDPKQTVVLVAKSMQQFLERRKERP